MPDNVPSSLYEINCKDISGKQLALKQFTSKALIIVNTASLCGYSSQFESLEELWQSYKNEGLVVLAVPSNEFGHQEPGDSQQIASLCLVKFGVSFPILEKTEVTGENAHPLFKWLEKEGNFWSKPRWNFYKYIIGRDGHLSDWFSTLSNPAHKRFRLAVSKAVMTKS